MFLKVVETKDGNKYLRVVLNKKLVKDSKNGNHIYQDLSSEWNLCIDGAKPFTAKNLIDLLEKDKK